MIISNSQFRIKAAPPEVASKTDASTLVRHSCIFPFIFRPLHPGRSLSLLYTAISEVFWSGGSEPEVFTALRLSVRLRFIILSFLRSILFRHSWSLLQFIYSHSLALFRHSRRQL